MQLELYKNYSILLLKKTNQKRTSQLSYLIAKIGSKFLIIGFHAIRNIRKMLFHGIFISCKSKIYKVFQKDKHVKVGKRNCSGSKV